MRRRAVAALVAAVAAGLASAARAQAADPGRWVLAQADHVPIEYFQGLTHSAAGSWFFAGPAEGLYRTDRRLAEHARNPQAIPPAVTLGIGFNHIGDPTWDRAEGGRLLLPLECYTPGAQNGGNTCGRGAFGVADPATLGWRYLVPLDPADIPKAMWAEVSPDGRLVWTSSGQDLLAYRTADITPQAAAAGIPPRPVARLAGAVPPSGVTGAAFYRGRLLLAGQAGGPLQMWSVDLTGRTPRRLEAELPGVAAESEGLDVLAARGGLLHWLLSPFAPGGRPPTYGTGHSELLTFVPRADARLRLSVTPARPVAGRPATLTARVTLFYAGRRHAVAGAQVQAGGRAARTDARGIVRLRVMPRPGAVLRVVATKQRLLPARATVRAGA